MPELVAGFHSLVGLAAVFVAISAFLNDICESSRFSTYAQISLQNSQKVLIMTEKIKTVIECYFLLPYFYLADTLLLAYKENFSRTLSCRYRDC